MEKIKLLKKRRERRKKGIRKKISGVANKPRLNIYRSNKFIYVQAIDDEKQVTLASASSLKLAGNLNKETCEKVGVEMAKKLKEKKIEEAVFDRNGFLYTGKIKQLADAIRKNGIKL